MSSTRSRVSYWPVCPSTAVDGGGLTREASVTGHETDPDLRRGAIAGEWRVRWWPTPGPLRGASRPRRRCCRVGDPSGSGWATPHTTTLSRCLPITPPSWGSSAGWSNWARPSDVPDEPCASSIRLTGEGDRSTARPLASYRASGPPAGATARSAQVLRARRAGSYRRTAQAPAITRRRGPGPSRGSPPALATLGGEHNQRRSAAAAPSDLAVAPGVLDRPTGPPRRGTVRQRGSDRRIRDRIGRTGSSCFCRRRGRGDARVAFPGWVVAVNPAPACG